MSSSMTVHSAALNKQYSLLRSLVADNPALINSVDADGRTPLHWASSSGATDIARYLLDQKADVDKTDGSGWTALHIAVSAGHEEIVRELVGAGADVQKPNDKGLTPLHRAATTGSVGFIKLLLESAKPPVKVRLNTADRVGNTPLHLAMESGHAEAAVLLINAGADRDRTNQDGLIPEQVEGVGESEQRQVRRYVIDHCGPLDA
ncbi:hypothetical protein ONZ45_g2454 [Pleurotus djamor]|nr:hypothetical protein ONZ45_g2454 [Pleurotus djamor]